MSSQSLNEFIAASLSGGSETLEGGSRHRRRSSGRHHGKRSRRHHGRSRSRVRGGEEVVDAPISGGRYRRFRGGDSPAAATAVAGGSDAAPAVTGGSAAAAEVAGGSDDLNAGAKRNKGGFTNRPSSKRFMLNKHGRVVSRKAHMSAKRRYAENKGGVRGHLSKGCRKLGLSNCGGEGSTRRRSSRLRRQ